MLAGGVLIAIALIIGIDDNLPGILLLFAGIVSLIIPFVYRWQKLNSYIILFASSVGGFILFAILHNLLDYAAQHFSDSKIGPGLFNILSAGTFMIAVIICPITILISIAGILYLLYRKQPVSK